MNRLFAAQRAAGNFNGAIADDFVDVHVGLGAAAGLPDAEREMVVEFARDDFVGGLRDVLGFFGGKFAEILIDQRGGFFEDAEGADQFGRHGVLANGEMDQRAGGLCAVVAVGGDVHFAHGVGFAAGVGGGGCVVWSGGLGGFGHRRFLGEEYKSLRVQK